MFAEHGYANARLDHVAAAAGLTKGAIYSNFASKHEVFFAMLDEQVLDRVESVRAALVASDRADGPMTAQQVGRFLTETITEQREWQLVFLDFWLRAVRDDDVRAQFVSHRRALRAAIADAVVQVIGAGPAPSDFSVEDVVTIVLALSNGLAVEQYIDAESVSPDLFGRVRLLLGLPFDASRRVTPSSSRGSVASALPGMLHRVGELGDRGRCDRREQVHEGPVGVADEQRAVAPRRRRGLRHDLDRAVRQ